MWGGARFRFVRMPNIIKTHVDRCQRKPLKIVQEWIENSPIHASLRYYLFLVERVVVTE